MCWASLVLYVPYSNSYSFASFSVLLVSLCEPWAVLVLPTPSPRPLQPVSGSVVLSCLPGETTAVFTYLGLGLSRSLCQAAGSCCTKSVLPDSMAPLSHSQEVQIQWGKLSIAMHRQSGQVARRLRQLKFKWVQKFFLALICSEFMLNSFEYGISYLFSSSSLLPSLQLSSCLSVFVQSVPCLWFLICGVCFAVFVQSDTLCFVSVLHFPLAAVKVSWRFPLCGSARGTCEPPHPVGKQRRKI